MPLPEIGAILAALSITAYFLGVFRTLSSIGIFLAILMIGINGWLISHLAAVFGFIAARLGPFVAAATGVSIAFVGAALVCVIGFILIHGWLPKNAAKKKHFWLAAVFAVIVVAGATPFAALNQLPAQVGSGVTQSTGG
jgi:uncharacterized BrkB/YihY/UPF0761 family membrane protein